MKRCYKSFLLDVFNAEIKIKAKKARVIDGYCTEIHLIKILLKRSKNNLS